MATSKLTVPILIDLNDIKAYMEQHDIVEVVRCKECKHWLDVCDTEDGVRYADCELFSDGHVFGENWFCKDGERREVTE